MVEGFVNTVGWFVRSGWRTRPMQTIALREAPASADSQAALRRAAQERRPARVILPPSSVLTKEERLPRKARSQAARILKLRKEALEEQSKTSLVAVSGKTNSNADQDVYKQYLIKASDVEAIRDGCKDAGIELKDVAISTEDEQLVILRQTTFAEQASRSWWVAALTLFLASAVGLLWQQISIAAAHEEQLGDLRSEIDQLEQDLTALNDVQNTRLEDMNRLQGAIDHLSSQQNASDHLAAITRLVPADAWLTEFTLHNAEIRLSGSSTIDPIVIIEAFEAESWVTSVNLMRPVRQDRPSQRSSFELQLILAEGG